MRAVGHVLCHFRTARNLNNRPCLFALPTTVRRFSTERVRKFPREAEQPHIPCAERNSVDDELVDKPVSIRRIPHLQRSDETRTTTASSDFEPLSSTLRSWRWLDKLSPGYPVHGSQVTVIQSPEHFYQTLIEQSKKASRRITFASLYLGIGSLEQELVKTIKENLDNSSSLEVKVLLDYARGSRGGDSSSRTMLIPLIRSLRNACEVFLYHTPTLRGVRKKLLPQRWNELIGLQHMKVYVFDDNVLITGANLSNDYFTNRQDRYFLIENCPELADFYNGLITQVTKFSFKLDSTNQVHLDSEWSHHPATSDVQKFVTEARKKIVSYYETCRSMNSERLEDFYDASNSSQQQSRIPQPSSKSRKNHADTWIFPLIQMGPFHISYDDRATSKILEDTEPGSTIKLATGYFNLTGEYIQRIIQKSASNYEILMAHPRANGFLGAKGPAGGIPAAYTLLATRFFNEVKDAGCEARIKMWEYVRPSWTFHGKGLWFYPAGEKLPFVTLIGSPNFGYRSVNRDLETQLYIVSRNPELRAQLHEEQKLLYRDSESFGEHVVIQKERIVPLWVHMVIKYFRDFF